MLSTRGVAAEKLQTIIAQNTIKGEKIARSPAVGLCFHERESIAVDHRYHGETRLLSGLIGRHGRQPETQFVLDRRFGPQSTHAAHIDIPPN